MRTSARSAQSRVLAGCAPVALGSKFVRSSEVNLLDGPSSTHLTNLLPSGSSAHEENEHSSGVTDVQAGRSASQASNFAEALDLYSTCGRLVEAPKPRYQSPGCSGSNSKYRAQSRTSLDHVATLPQLSLRLEHFGCHESFRETATL